MCGQSLAQMALAWALRDPRVTSIVIGATASIGLEDNLKSLQHPTFSAEESLPRSTGSLRVPDGTPLRVRDRSEHAVGVCYHAVA